MFSYVIGILVAGLIVFGLYFGIHVGSPAYARQVLANQAAEKSLDELEDMLVNGTTAQSIAAITVIGRGDDQIERRVELIAKATASRSETVQWICKLSIQRMGEAAKPTVRKLLASSNPIEVRGACGLIQPMGHDGDEFGPQVLKLFESENSFDRHAALYGIREMSPEVVLPGLKFVIKELDAEHFNTQIQACYVLKQLGSSASPATERLVLLLQKGIPSARSRAAEALAAIGPVDGFDIAELVGKQLEAKSYMEKVRGLAAVAAMGQAGKTPENLARITHLINSPNLNCLPEATLAMYRLTGEKEPALQTLQGLLQDRSTRTDALECLGAMGTDATEAVPQVMQYLNDEEESVVETAILALKNIGPTADAALPRLKKLLSHDDYLITVAAQEATDAISPKDSGP